MGWRNAAARLGLLAPDSAPGSGDYIPPSSIHITLSILATTSRDQGAMTPPQLRGITAPKYELSYTIEPDPSVKPAN